MSRWLNSRNVAMAKYICFFVAAVLFVLNSNTSVKEQANQANVILWHVFMILGAVVGFYGAITKRYLIEGLALPLLGAALAAYVAILLSIGIGTGRSSPAGVGFIILTAILGLIGRGIVLWELSGIERDITRREGADG